MFVSFIFYSWRVTKLYNHKLGSIDSNRAKESFKISISYKLNSKLLTLNIMFSNRFQKNIYELFIHKNS